MTFIRRNSSLRRALATIEVHPMRFDCLQFFAPLRFGQLAGVQHRYLAITAPMIRRDFSRFPPPCFRR